MLRKLVLIAMIITSVGMFTGCKKNEQAQQSGAAQPSPTVVVDSAILQNIAASETFVGTVDAAVKASITARVSGFLEKKLVKEGDNVEKGQILFTIEKNQYAAEVKSAEATLAQMKADEHNAKLQRDRGEALLKSSSISQSNFDTLEATYLKAVANVAAAKAALDVAKLNLSYTDIRSPINGQVGFISPNIGETISASSGEITEIISMEPMYVVFSVTDRQLQNIRKKFAQNSDIESMEQLTEYTQLRIVLSDGTEYPELGRMNFVNNKVTDNTDAIKLRAVFDKNMSNMLRDGQTVTVFLESKTKTETLTVSQIAVMNDIGGTYVLVVNKDNAVERKNVTLGSLVGNARQIVLSGLENGDRVIVDGVQKVRIGATVVPMTQDEYNNMAQQSR